MLVQKLAIFSTAMPPGMGARGPGVSGHSRRPGCWATLLPFLRGKDREGLLRVAHLSTPPATDLVLNTVLEAKVQGQGVGRFAFS